MVPVIPGAKRDWVPNSEPGPAAAFSQIARKWSRAFSSQFPQGPQVELGLYREIISYALCQMQVSLGDVAPDERKRCLSILRAECAEPFRGSAEAGTGTEQNESSVARLTRLGRSALNKEAFEHFSLSTGLGADVLVGSNGNLASLVFYIVVHSVLLQAGPLSREQVRKLLLLARGCRTEVENAICAWSAEPFWLQLGGLPAGRQVQNGKPNVK